MKKTGTSPSMKAKGKMCTTTKEELSDMSQTLPGSSIVRIIGNRYFNLTLPLHRVSPLHRKAGILHIQSRLYHYLQYL